MYVKVIPNTVVTWGFIGGKAGVDIRDNTCQCLCILAISISQTLDNVHHDV